MNKNTEYEASRQMSLDLDGHGQNCKLRTERYISYCTCTMPNKPKWNTEQSGKQIIKDFNNAVEKIRNG